mmetsp:Transcript_157993/g.291306  ORF Transcript_157993/g.291306 Transcript_157993/m.291306 type:complete len:1286 (-) Transcript_157993:13-3870(-)
MAPTSTSFPQPFETAEQLVEALNATLSAIAAKGLLPEDPNELDGLGFSVAGARFVLRPAQVGSESLSAPWFGPLAAGERPPQVEVRVDSLATVKDLMEQRISAQALLLRRKLAVRGSLERLQKLGRLFEGVNPLEIQDLLPEAFRGYLPQAARYSSVSAGSFASSADSQGFWRDDSTAPDCSSCGRRFTLTRRRHHCRSCGDIFCRDCAPRRPTAVLCSALRGKAGPVRLCAGCAGGAPPGRCSSFRSADGSSLQHGPTSMRSLRSASEGELDLARLGPMCASSARPEEDAEVSHLKEELRKVREVRLHDFASCAHLASQIFIVCFTATPALWAIMAYWLLGWGRIVQGFLLYFLVNAAVIRHLRVHKDSLWRRRVSVFWVAFVIFVRIRWTKLRCRDLPMGSAPRELLWDETHRIVAFYVYQNFLRLRGFWVKVGQYVSSRQDVMPEPYLYWFRKLQDQNITAPMQEILQTVTGELGPELAATLRLEQAPLGSASVAQVHRARCVQPGMAEKDVVVKVQHRNISKTMMQDVSSFEVILTMIAKWEPDWDVRALIYEWKAASVRELDFAVEAENQKRALEALKRFGLTTQVLIPEIIDKYTRTKVLVMDFVDAVKIDSVREELPQVDPNKLVEKIVDAFALQIHVDGHFNGDPHPGNLMVEKKTLRPVLLDWGLCKTFTEKSRKAFAKMVFSVDSKDIWTMMESFEEMGFKFRGADSSAGEGDGHLEPNTALEIMRFVMSDPGPKEDTRELMMKRGEVDEKKFNHDRGLKRRDPVEAFSGEVLFFFRTVDCLKGLCTGLQVCLPFLKIMAARARGALLEGVAGPALDPHQLVTPCAPASGFRGPLEEGLYRLLAEFARNNRLAGAQVSVVRSNRGQQAPILADMACGVLSPLDPRPIQQDTPFVAHSLSQLPLSILLLHLLDKGKLSLDQTIAKDWPTFSAQGKDGITISHILSRTSGLWHCFPKGLNMRTIMDLEHALKAVASAHLLDEPGQAQGHHYWTFGWLLAGICRHLVGSELTTCWTAAFNELLSGAISKELQLPGALLETTVGASAKIEKAPVAGVDAAELMGALARMSAEVESDAADEYSQFLEPIFCKEHLLDMQLCNLREAKGALSLCAQGVHTTARALAQLLAACAPAREPAGFVQKAFAEAAGLMADPPSVPGVGQLPSLARPLVDGMVPLPGLLAQAFLEPALVWPGATAFSAYGLQRLEHSTGLGAGASSPESGAFAYWLPHHPDGACSVCLLVSRLDARESGLADAVLEMVCRGSKNVSPQAIPDRMLGC